MMRLTHPVAFLICVIAAYVSAAAGCGGGQATPKLYNRLIFLTRQSGDYDIRLRTSNDRQPIELGRVLPWDSQPVWSPDGSRIAFYSDRNFNLPDRDDNVDIYVMAPDGSGLTRLTNDPASDAFPYWSPDGQRLAFYSERDGQGDVYIMNADGSGVKRVTDDAALDIPYGWSPDGQRLLVSSGRSGNLDLFTMKTDGGDVKRVTSLEGDDVAAQWSPDGSEIAFESATGRNVEVYAVNADGSNLVDLTLRPLRDAHPVRAPDSVRLAFVSDRTA